MSGRGSKLFGYVDWRIRVVLSDTRSINGTLMAFDKHMNLVLADCEEVRKIKSKQSKQSNDMKDDNQSNNQSEREEKRALGLVMIRGESVIALAVLSPPKAKPKATVLAAAAAAKSSAGVAVPMTAGRGVIPMPSSIISAGPIGLTGPVRGVGGPAPMNMQSMGPIPMPPMPPMPMPPGAMPQFMPQFAPQYAAPGFPGPPMPPMGRGLPPMPMPPMPMGRYPMPPPGLPPQQ